jgi:hypothetical protein
MNDLFGNEIVPAACGPKRSYAHPDRPGTGPQGEACASCSHVRRVGRYFKCAVIKESWTHGPGSDLRLKDKACSRWEKSVGAMHEVNV